MSSKCVLMMMIIFNCANGMKYRQGIEKKKAVWLQEQHPPVLTSPCQRDG